MQSTTATADSMPENTERTTVAKKRRWFRFGLRALLVLVTLVCVWLGWLMHGVHKQRQAVAKLEKYGARFVYFPVFAMPPWNEVLPRWLRAGLNSALPSDDWRRLTSIQIESVGFREEDLDILKDVPHLSNLRLPGTRLTDAGLQRLRRLDLKNLRLLDLRGTKISDAGLAELADRKQLQWLFLGGTSITDAGLRHLSNLTNLEHLSLEDTQVTDAGIAHLRSLQRLDDLSLDRTRVTGTCLEHLSAIKSLRVLDLRETQVSGEGLASLARLPKLEVAILNDTPVSDTDLPYLQQAPHISALWVRGTKLSGEAIRQLPNARTGAAQPARPPGTRGSG